MILQKKLRRFQTADLIRQLLAAWLLAVTVEYLLLPSWLRDLSGMDGLAAMSLGRVLLLTALGTVLLWGISHFVNTVAVERWCIVGIFAVLAGVSLRASFSKGLLCACIVLFALLVVYAIRGWDSSPEPVFTPRSGHKACLWVTVGLTVLFFLFVSVWTVSRIYCFSTPTYDFGIFSQMFYHMKESGLPMTTLERDGLMSHFMVHMSPIWYLLLPFYLLAPSPVTLQVLQAAVMASAVIPLWRIGKDHGLSGVQRMLLCAVLLLYPAFSGGASYDIHENCFLMPLLLWLFHGIDRKNTCIITISALLTLMVKEDAAVYVAVIALWLMVRTVLHWRKENKKDLFTAAALLLVSLLWFFLATGYLARSGDGVMTYRYQNFMFDGDSSLFTVVLSVLLNPMKALSECVESGKLYFILLTMLPLLGLPLLTRRYERYILLIPYILINLMSDYKYQHNIFFQYTFGSAACLLYLTAVNLAELKLERQRTIALAAAAFVGGACFCMRVVPKAIKYPLACIREHDTCQSIRSALSAIPEDAPVTATFTYTTFLSQRETLYDVGYASKEHVLQTDYVVLGLDVPEGDFRQYATEGEEDGFENFIKFLEENGYTVLDEVPGELVIYSNSNEA